MKQSARVFVCAVASSSWVAQGCTGDSTFALPPVEAGVPDARYADACAVWSQATCAYQERCRSGASFGWLSVEQCIEREALGCQLASADTDVSFDEDRVRDCQFPDDCAAPAPACWPPGKVPPGAGCLWDASCQSGVCAGMGTGAACGVCRDCSSTCPVGEVCVGLTNGSGCDGKALAPGEVCASGSDCRSATCSPAQGDGGSVCAPFGALGDACAPGQPRCAEDSYCQSESQQCKPLQTASNGGACGRKDNTGALYVCQGFASCLLGVCAPPVADGAVCDPIQGVVCLWPAQCVANHCVFPTALDCSP